MATITPQQIHRLARERVLAQMATNEADWRKPLATETDEVIGYDDVTHRAWKAMNDVIDHSRELERCMQSAEREFEQARRYCRGESAALNNLGILQSNGPRIDVLVALIHSGVDTAIAAERDRIKLELEIYFTAEPGTVEESTAPDLMAAIEAAATGEES